MLMKMPLTPDAIDDHVPALSAPRSYVRRMTRRGLLPLVGAWIERSRQRHALADLDDRLLDDVGIPRSAAAREIAKPFWR